MRWSIGFPRRIACQVGGVAVTSWCARRTGLPSDIMSRWRGRNDILPTIWMECCVHDLPIAATDDASRPTADRRRSVISENASAPLPAALVRRRGRLQAGSAVLRPRC